jgi:polyhydroxyalkanoate synthase
MMHKSYLRNMYLENKLVKLDGMELKGVQLNISSVKTPFYKALIKDDHIALWKWPYAVTQQYSVPVKLVLSTLGNIVGIINPLVANKYSYWSNDKKPPVTNVWFDRAEVNENSWWGNRDKWVSKYRGTQVKKWLSLVVG